MSSSDGCANVTYGYVDPNFPRPGVGDDACIIIYGYTPSLALCLLGLILFFIALLGHAWLLFRHKSWYFATMLVGIICEIVGYIARTLSSQRDPYMVTYFVIQYFFIVVAPVFFSAAIYTVITVTINRIGKQYAPLPPKLILWTFIICDIIATIIQIAGAALVGSAYSNNTDPTTPNHILLAGLAFQICSFAIFIIILSLFLYKSRHVTSRSFHVFSAAVFVATLAVYLRTCFRLAETAQGLLESLSTHEVFFGCLEFLPVVVVAVYVFLWWYPGKWLKKDGRILFADHDGHRLRHRQQQRQQQTQIHDDHRHDNTINVTSVKE